MFILELKFNKGNLCPRSALRVKLIIYRTSVSIREISSGGKKTKSTGNTEEVSGDVNGETSGETNGDLDLDDGSTGLGSEEIGYYEYYYNIMLGSSVI